MEMVLGAIGDYIHKTMKKRRVLKPVLLVIIFTIGCGLAFVEWAVLFGG